MIGKNVMMFTFITIKGECMRSIGILLLAVFLSGSVAAKGTPTWKESGNVYKGKTALPVNSLALGAVNVDVGVHLERLTLLSGEVAGRSADPRRARRRRY
jgi:hypothetical protein